MTEIPGDESQQLTVDRRGMEWRGPREGVCVAKAGCQEAGRVGCSIHAYPFKEQAERQSEHPIGTCESPSSSSLSSRASTFLMTDLQVLVMSLGSDERVMVSQRM